MVRGDGGPRAALAFGGNNTAGPIDVATALSSHGGPHGGPHGRLDFESETFVADLAPTLAANGKAAGSATQQDAENGALVAHAFDVKGGLAPNGTPALADTAFPLNATDHKDQQLVCHAFDARQRDVIQYGDKTGPLDTDPGTIAICFSAKDYGADAQVDLAPTLRAGAHAGSHANAGVMPAIAYSIMPQNSGRDFKAREVDVAQPLMAAGPAGGNQGGDYIVQPLEPLSIACGCGHDFAGELDTPCPACGVIRDAQVTYPPSRGGAAVAPIPFDTTQITHPENRSNPQPGDPACTLSKGGHAPAIAIPIAESGKRTGVSSTSIKAGDGLGADGDPMFTLGADSRHAVAFALRGRDDGAVPEVHDDGQTAGALRAASGGSTRDMVACTLEATAGRSRGAGTPLGLLAPTAAVRRLTPRECERLQGFPDGHTAIPWKGQPATACPDGPRYKGLGNSWPVDVVRYIGERIETVRAATGEGAP